MKRPLAVIAIALLGLSACGSSVTRLSKAEYVKQANALCKTGQAQANKEAEKASAAAATLGQTGKLSASDAVKVADALEAGLKDIEAAENKVSKLHPPKADQAQVDAINAEFDKADKTAKTELTGLRDKADTSFLRQNTTFEAFNAKAKAYGLTDCAE